MFELPRLPRTMLMTATTALLALTAAGCETTAPYAGCSLDKEVTDKGICTGTSANTSCVVKKHPQCDLDVCLSYYSMPAICTQPCTSDAQCPADSAGAGTCWEFAPADAAKGTPAEKYCISATTKAAKVAADNAAGK